MASSLFSDSSDEEKTPKPKKEKVKLKQFLPQTPTSATKSKKNEETSSPKKVKKDKASPDKSHIHVPSGQLKVQYSDGIQCLKCDAMCRDVTHLKNHLLSHFYQDFYVLLPSAKPFPCPICEKESRDRITLLRHYAFAHDKAQEVTGYDFKSLGGGPVRRRTAPEAGTPKRSEQGTPKIKKSTPKPKAKTIEKVEKSKAIIENDSDSSGDELLDRANQRLAGMFLINLYLVAVFKILLYKDNWRFLTKHLSSFDSFPLLLK